MASQPLRIGVIGVGFGSRVQIPAFLQEGLEVAAVCARRRERAERVAREFDIPHAYADYREMLRLPGLDAVSIVTPRYLHHPMAMAALAAGKHVLCEKPFAMNQGEAREMWSKAGESGLTAMIDHELRYLPARAYVKELVEEGFVGDLRSVHVAMYLGPNTATPRVMMWSSVLAEGGGFLTGRGSHWFDTLRDWFGEITGVCGRVFMQETRRWDEERQQVVEADTDDAFGCIFTFASGAWGTISASFAAPFGVGTDVQIYGSKGMLELPRGKGDESLEAVVRGARLGEDQATRELPVPDRFKSAPGEQSGGSLAFRALVRRFLEGIDQGTSPSPSFYDGLRCQQVLDAVARSGADGRWIAIPRG